MGKGRRFSQYRFKDFERDRDLSHFTKSQQNESESKKKEEKFSEEWYNGPIKEIAPPVEFVCEFCGQRVDNMVLHCKKEHPEEYRKQVLLN